MKRFLSICLILFSIQGLFAAEPTDAAPAEAAPAEAAPAEAAAPGKPSTEAEKVGYALGLNVAMSLHMMGLTDKEMSTASFIQAISDVFGEKDLQLDPEEADAILKAFSQKMQAKMMAEQGEQGGAPGGAAMEDGAEAGSAFLKGNAAKEGVKVTESGLQYKVLEDGKGPKPKVTDKVSVHYEGTLVDGTVFDSSFKRGEPVSFPLDQVIAGWTEGLQLMNVGSTYQFVIPAELAYGAQGFPPNIPPNSTLVFKVQLLGIVD